MTFPVRLAACSHLPIPSPHSPDCNFTIKSLVTMRRGRDCFVAPVFLACGGQTAALRKDGEEFENVRFAGNLTYSRISPQKRNSCSTDQYHFATETIFNDEQIGSPLQDWIPRLGESGMTDSGRRDSCRRVKEVKEIKR